MRKFVFVMIAVSIVGVMVNCVPNSIQNGPKRTMADMEASDRVGVGEGISSDRLAFWFPHHDSVNHGLVSLAEELWRIDSASANGSLIDREKWYDKCERVLTHGFDSTHQGSNLASSQKADSMLAEIEAFFEKDADLSTMGMITNFDLQYSFLIYRMTALSKQVLHEIPAFDKEIEAWNDLQGPMCDFCLGVVNLDWFGGSGAEAEALAQRNSIVQCRIDDLKRIVRLCSEDSLCQNPNVNNILLKSKTRFKDTIERTASSVSTVDEAKGYLPETLLKYYADLYVKFQKSKQPLMDAFVKWTIVRSHAFQGSALEQNEDQIRNNDVIAIDALSECVASAKVDV